MEKSSNEIISSESTLKNTQKYPLNIEILPEKEKISLENDSNQFIEDKSLRGNIELEKKFFTQKYLRFFYSFFYFITFVLMFLITPSKHNYKPTVYIPIEIVFSILAIALILHLLYNGFSYQYIFDLNRKKLIKRNNFFNINFTKEIADFNQIKMIGVSTIAKEKLSFGQTTGIEYFNEIIVVYKDYNAINNMVLETNQYGIDEDIVHNSNVKAYALSKILGCDFIPSDKTTKIIVKEANSPQDDIQSLITFLPKEKQLPEIDFKNYPTN